MKILIIADQDINTTDLGQITREVAEMYQINANVTQEYAYEYLDYANYPVEQYWGGYWGIQHQWLRDKCADIYKRWGEEVVCVVFAISSENWRLTGVWGWNMSATFSSYGVQQVRIAQNPRHTAARNINNSVGTLWHEMMHDVDGFVFTNTGKTVEPIVGVTNWDSVCVHGEHPEWDYIRHKENQRALKAVSTVFREALAKREAHFQLKVGLYKTYIELLTQLRNILASQRGDVAILSGGCAQAHLLNKCNHVK